MATLAFITTCTMSISRTKSLRFLISSFITIVDPLPLLLFNVAKNYTSPEEMKCPHSYVTCGNNLLYELQKFRILYSYTFHGVAFHNSIPYWYSEQCKMTSGLILYMQGKHQLYYSAFLIEFETL